MNDGQKYHFHLNSMTDESDPLANAQGHALPSSRLLPELFVCQKTQELVALASLLSEYQRKMTDPTTFTIDKDALRERTSSVYMAMSGKNLGSRGRTLGR